MCSRWSSKKLNWTLFKLYIYVFSHFLSLVIDFLNFLNRLCYQLFAANQNKPPEIVNVLVTNKSKLLRFFGSFCFDKGINLLALSSYILISAYPTRSDHAILMWAHSAAEDEDFKADKAQVVSEIESLEAITPSASPQRCEIPC